MWKRLDESIALSEKLGGLSWVGLGTWTYLLSQTDTMGRFHRDSRIVKAKCMTMRYEVRPETVEEALLEIEQAGLLHCYAAEDGRRYLVLHNYREFNPPGALGRVSPKYPAPPPGVCACTDEERRKEGVEPGVPSTLFSAEKSVRTPDVTSPVMSTSSLVVVQGEEKALPDSPESRIVRLAIQSKVIYASERQLRTHIGGWIADKGFQFVESLFMNPAIRGKDIFSIHETYFKAQRNGKGAPGAKRKVINPECGKCSGKGRRPNPATGGEMDCGCVREVAV